MNMNWLEFSVNIAAQGPEFSAESATSDDFASETGGWSGSGGPGTANGNKNVTDFGHRWYECSCANLRSMAGRKGEGTADFGRESREFGWNDGKIPKTSTETSPIAT
jgi:hypothetical protein